MPEQQFDTRAFHLASTVCSEREYNTIVIKDEHKTGQASLKFFRVFCNGFARNDRQIKVLCKRPTTKNKSGKTVIPAAEETDDGVFYHYMRTINVPVFGNLYAAVAAFFYFLNPAKCKRHDVVFVDPLNAENRE